MVSARIEGSAYSICLVVMFVAVGIWESFQPARGLSGPVERRWKNHGAMLLIGALSTLLLRSTPVAMAVIVSGSSLGLLNKPWLPLPARVVLAILLLDAIQYWIHRSFHHAGLLWRIHQVHHSDPDFDVSTAGRFHPFEVLWTQALHLGAIALLAPPPVAVLISLLLTVILNMTTHANASLPEGVDRMLRMLFVTPDMHRIHHSQEVPDQQSNFGQTFGLWDRVFGTYKEITAVERTELKAGLKGPASADAVSIRFMLAAPFQEPSQEEPAAAPGPGN